MSNKAILDAIKKSRETAKARKFKQTFDLCVNVRAMDLKKAENKVKAEVSLPNPLKKDFKIGIFADTLIPQVNNMKNESLILIRRDEIENYGRDKKKAKILAKRCKSFLAESALMPLVGKHLGPVLAVRNKMPKPIPPTIPNILPLIKRDQSSFKLMLKDMPVFHCPVGGEEMDDEKIAENVEAVINGITAALPRGKDNIKNYFIKLTMGKAVKFTL